MVTVAVARRALRTMAGVALLASLGCDGRPTPAARPPCASCHAADRGRATRPDHNAAGFSAACETCHNETAWRPATAFAHPGDLPLVGKHGELTCARCHDLSPLPTTCQGCHEAARASAKQPDHLAAGFLSECDICHVPLGWSPAVDHRKFPLSGQHLRLTCDSCHTAPPVPATCVSCHEAARQRASFPDHRQPGYPTTCENCHVADGWHYTRYNHTTKFPLTNAHAPLTCLDCHRQRPLPKTCVGCHDADRARGADPDHLAPTFSRECSSCHTTAAWTPASRPPSP